MIALIKKDFKLIKLWEYFIFTPAIVFLFIAALSASLNPYWLSVLFLTVGLCATASNRELMYGERLIHSLPITRKEYILSKYVSVIPWFIVSSIFVACIYFLLFSGSEARYVTIDALFFTFLSVVIAVSLLYPLLFFKRKIAFVTFGVLAVTFANLPLFFEFPNFVLISQRMKVASLLLTLLLVTLSYRLSTYIYEKKDF